MRFHALHFENEGLENSVAVKKTRSSPFNRYDAFASRAAKQA